MSDYYGNAAVVKFSNELPQMVVYAAAIADGMKSLSGRESRIIGEVLQCLTAPGKSREICLNGLTRAGKKRLREMLDQHSIKYKYIPMIHHYRAPSEPARLVVNVH